MTAPGFTRSPAFDGVHGTDVAINSLALEGWTMKKLFRRIRRRLAYLAKDNEELTLLVNDLVIALAAAAFGAAAMFAAMNLE